MIANTAALLDDFSQDVCASDEIEAAPLRRYHSRAAEVLDAEQYAHRTNR